MEQINNNITEQAEREPWRDYLPEYVNLYYIDYRDTLNELPQTMAECIRTNSLYPVSEEIYDWDTDEALSSEMREMKAGMQQDGIEWDSDWNEAVYEALRDLDQSTPVDDILRNTGEVSMFYDLGMEYYQPWDMDKEEKSEAVAEICGILNIPMDDEKRVAIIKCILENCGYGGNLRIYFRNELGSAISEPRWDENSEDFKTIKFKGSYTVAIHDSARGGGWGEEVELDCAFVFNRDNLQLAAIDGNYSYQETYGCAPDGDTAAFCMEESQSAKQVGNSQLNAANAQIDEYKRIFSEGACTLGDIDMGRHRDVKYRNEYPCGWKCPHCGQFWID